VLARLLFTLKIILAVRMIRGLFLFCLLVRSPHNTLYDDCTQQEAETPRLRFGLVFPARRDRSRVGPMRRCTLLLGHWVRGAVGTLFASGDGGAAAAESDDPRSVSWSGPGAESRRRTAAGLSQSTARTGEEPDLCG